MTSSIASASEHKEALAEETLSIDSHFAQLKAREAQLRQLDEQLNARKADLVQRIDDRVSCPSFTRRDSSHCAPPDLSFC